MSNSVIIASAVGIIQSLIFGLLIIIKKRKKSSDWVLLLWFLVFSCHLLMIIAIQNNPTPIILALGKNIGLLHGPFLFLYTMAVFNTQFSKTGLLHITPFLFFTAGTFFITAKWVLTWEILLLVSKTASLVIYPIYVRGWLKKRLAHLKNTRSDNYILESMWINTIIVLLLIFAGVGIFHVFANVFLGIEFSMILDIGLYVSVITIIGFYGLRYQVVFEPDIDSELSSKQRYKNSPLDRQKVIERSNMIADFFENTDEYLSSNFSLSILSETLDIPKHHLSEILNLDMDTTFYDLVNSKRIQYAMQRIKEGSDKNITLEGLGYECGFNTKSAFYHHFKHYTGKTPGKFKSEIRPD